MEKSFAMQFAKFVTANRMLFFIAYLTLIGISSFIVTHRFFSDEPFVDNSISVWFNKNDPDLVQFKKFQDVFGHQEWSSILIRTKNIYDKNFLNELRSVTTAIEEMPVVIRATSLANVRGNRLLDGEELLFTAILEEDDDDSEWGSVSDLTAFKDRLNDNTFITNLLHKTSDQSHTLILIQSENRLDDPGSYRQDYYDDIYDILKNRSTFEYVGFQGNAPLIVELNKAAVRDVFIFYNTTSVFLFLLGLFVFRNLKDTIVLLSMSIGVMTPAMAAIAAAGIPYNMMTQIMPVLLVAVATANVVHLIKEFHRNRQTMNNKEAVEKAIAMLWTAGFWAAVTTMVGFASFMFSEVRPVGHIGIFGSIGIILGWLLSVTVAPFILLFLYRNSPPVSAETNNPGDKFISEVPVFIQNNQNKIVTVFVLFLFGLIGLKNITIESNFVEFISESTPTRSSFAYSQSKGFAGSAIHLSLFFEQGTFISEASRFGKLVELERKLEDLASRTPNFHVVLGPGKILWEVEKALSDNVTSLEEFSRFNEGQLSDLIFSSELSGNDQLVDFISEDKRQVRIALLTDYMGSKTLQAFTSELEALLESIHIDDTKIVFTGNQVLLSNMDTHVAETQFYSLSVVTLFLLILLPVLFKSIPLGLLGVLLNIFPLAFIYSVMALLSIPINLATVIIGGVSLSLVVDDTIHFLNRFSLNRKLGYDWNKAIDETISTIGHSVSLTSVILAVTFSVMMFSNYLPVRYFGIFFCVTVFVAWLVDIFLLPVLLRAYGRYTVNSSK